MLQTIITILYILLIITVVVVILVDNGDSGRKFAWLLIIAAIPLFGILLYFMFGINYRHHWIFNRRHQKYKDIFEKETNEDLNRILFGHDTEALVREDFRPLAEKYPVKVLIRFLFEDVLVLLVPPVEDPVVPVIDTEHEVQQDSEEGNGSDDQQPCEFPS